MKESIALNDQNGTETDCCHHWKINDDADATAAAAERRSTAAASPAVAPSPIPIVGGAIPRLFILQDKLHSNGQFILIPFRGGTIIFLPAFLMKAQVEVAICGLNHR